MDLIQQQAKSRLIVFGPGRPGYKFTPDNALLCFPGGHWIYVRGIIVSAVVFHNLPKFLGLDLVREEGRIIMPDFLHRCRGAKGESNRVVV